MEKDEYLKKTGFSAEDSEVSPAAQRLVNERKSAQNQSEDGLSEQNRRVSPSIKEYLKKLKAHNR